jgi:phosphoglycerate dehydrogenase-like enzyme
VFIPEPLHPEVMERIMRLASVRSEADRAAEFAIVRNYRVNQALLDRLPALRLVLKHGAGLDRVDTALLDERGIRWLATPGLNANGVAELAILQALRLLRGVGLDGMTAPPRELAGRRVGVLGLGRVGQRISRMASRGFGAEVHGHDPYLSQAPDGISLVDRIDDAVDAAGVLFVSCPLTAETTGLIDASVLDRMEEHAVVVNTARPPIVDNDSMLRALESGRVRGYAHDFLGEEDALGLNPQRGVVTSTQHIGGATEEALLRTGEEVARLLESELLGRPL